VHRLAPRPFRDLGAADPTFADSGYWVSGDDVEVLAGRAMPGWVISHVWPNLGSNGPLQTGFGQRCENQGWAESSGLP
jgi:hypothetical protein